MTQQQKSGAAASSISSVLFLGNSYTYFNEMPSLFAAAARAGGHDVQVESLTRGGCFLRQFLDPADPLYEKLHILLSEKRFDAVVLQEQSVLPAAEPDAFLDAARTLCSHLRPLGARIFLYQTWGRKEPNEILEKHGWTHRSMTEKLARAYTLAAKTLGCGRVPVGSAFSDINGRFPQIELYNKDHSHPSAAGSYLAALCHFAVLFGQSPEKLDYTAGLPAETARILKQAAARAAEGLHAQKSM